MTGPEPTLPVPEPRHGGTESVHVSTRFAVIALWSLVCAAVMGWLTWRSGAAAGTEVLVAVGTLGGAFFALRQLIR